MEKEKLQYFKEKLISEQLRVLDLIDELRRSETINFNSEIASELSFYDNHPSDIATELFEKEKGLALKKNEVSIKRCPYCKALLLPGETVCPKCGAYVGRD